MTSLQMAQFLAPRKVYSAYIQLIILSGAKYFDICKISVFFKKSLVSWISELFETCNTTFLTV